MRWWLMWTWLAVMFCKRCVPPQACRGAHARTPTPTVRWRQPALHVCVRVPGLLSCSLMPFTCFSQHQSAQGLQPFILIRSETGKEKKTRKEKCSCRLRGKNRFKSGYNTKGSNVSGKTFADQGTVHAHTHTRRRAQIEAEGGGASNPQWLL